MGCALAAATAVARDEYTRTFDRMLTLPGGAQVLLEHRLGDISVRTHPGSEVNIHADIRVSAGDSSNAKGFADRIEILVEPSASQLSIRTRYPEQVSSVFGFRNISYSVHYDLVIPETAPLELRNAFGAVSVTGAKAGSRITNSHGQLAFRDGRGTQRLENSFASIEVQNNAGDVFVEGSNGSVDISDIKGAATVHDRFASVHASRVAQALTIADSNGSVEVSDAGSASVRNAFGSVTVRDVRGDVNVSNANGKVDASNVRGGATLNTTFGEVTFTHIGGALSVQANNSKVEGDNVGGTATIRNSFGAVNLSNVTGSASVHSNNGAISVTDVKGGAELKSSFGMIQATNIGGLLTVENGNGAVKGSRTKGAQVTTSFGSVVLEGISGPIEVNNQNGSIDAASSANAGCQPIRLRTSFSNLRVHLEGEANYRLAAHTSFGKISSDFPITTSGSLSGDQMQGVIGSGGCDMTLTNKNGSIEVLKGGL